MSAGTLSHRVRFERQAEIDDGHGNTLGAYAPLFTMWAAFKATPGGEKVEAGRLESTVNGTLTVRACQASEGVLPSDRTVFTAGRFNGKTAQIRSIVPSDDGETIAMALEIGVAT